MDSLELVPNLVQYFGNFVQFQLLFTLLIIISSRILLLGDSFREYVLLFTDPLGLQLYIRITQQTKGYIL